MSNEECKQNFFISHSSFLILHFSFFISHSSFLILHFSFIISHLFYLFLNSLSMSLLTSLSLMSALLS